MLLQFFSIGQTFQPINSLNIVNAGHFLKHKFKLEKIIY